MNLSFESNQKLGEVQSTHSNQGDFEVRAWYAVSSESKESGEAGQDYLALRLGHSRSGQRKCVFVVCDGVGSSFLGDVAARLLGQNLFEALWGTGGEPPWFGIHRTAYPETVEQQLAAFLEQRLGKFRRYVQDLALSTDLSPLVRSALERQREYGSEAMFVCGRLLGNQLHCAWLGDTRLIILGEDNCLLFRNEPDTSQRWSSNAGLRGQIHTCVFKDDELFQARHVLAFSDGLASVSEHLVNMTEQQIDSAIAELRQTPQSDDVSLVHLML